MKGIDKTLLLNYFFHEYPQISVDQKSELNDENGELTLLCSVSALKFMLTMYSPGVKDKTYKKVVYIMKRDIEQFIDMISNDKIQRVDMGYFARISVNEKNFEDIKSKKIQMIGKKTILREEVICDFLKFDVDVECFFEKQLPSSSSFKLEEKKIYGCETFHVLGPCKERNHPKKTICDHCLKILFFSCLILTKFVSQIIGDDRCCIFPSGNRGYHVWYPNQTNVSEEMKQSLIHSYNHSTLKMAKKWLKDVDWNEIYRFTGFKMNPDELSREEIISVFKAPLDEDVTKVKHMLKIPRMQMLMVPNQKNWKKTFKYWKNNVPITG